MSPAKIVRILGLVVVLVAALIPGIPYTALALAILGLGIGYYVAKDNRVTLFLITIVLLSGAAGALEPVPGLGPYLTAILVNLAELLAAASVAVTSFIVYERMTE